MPPVAGVTQIPPASPTPKPASPEKIANAAQQFESLLIGQILKSVHEEGANGWLGEGEDESASSAMELAQEQFAQALAARGGLGLSHLIVQNLSRQGVDSPK